jgi:uroporphyrinogen-III decarboxylase
VFEPLTDLRPLVARYGQTHALIGNVDTRALLYGSREEIRAEVARCVDLGRECPGFFLCVGNHIPPNTPVENALYYNEVYEELARR